MHRNSFSRCLAGVAAAILFAILALPAAAQMSAMQHASTAPAPKVDIVRDPAEVPPPVGDRAPATVRVTLNAVEVIGELDPAAHTTYRYWTFNGKLPGPMIRVRQGDTVEVTLHNDAASHMVHSVDFHAALGPGGGAAYSQALPGQSKTFSFQATTPGLFVYHCGTPMIADHIANGMYGLILVEPAGGMTRVDHEYYVMQGEIYTVAAKGKPGLQTFSEAKLAQEAPEYFVFNGAVDALTKQHPLHANTGQTVRIFFGDAGPNATSSLHVVGEIFTHDYVSGSLTSPPVNGVQTASVPPGGAAILELKTVMPGNFNFMDHAMARMAKGLMGTIEIQGQETADMMHAGNADAPAESARGDRDPASAPASMSPAPQAMMDMPMPASEMAAAQPRAREIADSPTHVAGCLTLAGGVPHLAVFHSRKTYSLDPRRNLLVDNPLAFAANRNALVEIQGRREGETFLVDQVEQLAANCETTHSLAHLKIESKRRAARAASTFQTASAVTVGMGDMVFLQPQIVINAGQQVTWKNTSTVTHNVVTDASKAGNPVDVKLPGGAQAFDSGYLQPGQAFSYKFTVPGVYKYVCTLHESGGMKGTVIVKPAGVAIDMAKK